MLLLYSIRSSTYYSAYYNFRNLTFGTFGSGSNLTFSLVSDVASLLRLGFGVGIPLFVGIPLLIFLFESSARTLLLDIFFSLFFRNKLVNDYFFVIFKTGK